MLYNAFIASLRRLHRHKGVVSINVAGLTLALAATFLLGLFVEHERSYDNFHDHANDIYRLMEEEDGPSGMSVSGLTRMPVLPTLVRETPEVATGTRIRRYNTLWLGGPNSRQEVTPTYVDSTFFDVFDFEVLRGNARAAVATPNTIALTESLTNVLFGDANPVGRTLDVDFGKDTYRVAAVLADPPGNSTVQFEALMSRRTLSADVLDRIGGWYNTNTTAYVRLKPLARRTALAEKLPAFSNRHFERHESGSSVLSLLPLVEEHARLTNSTMLIRLLGGLALALLLIAAINSTNLMAAYGLDRVGEMGMRRALGARQRELAGQFLLESVVIAGIALVGAALLVATLLPRFNQLLDLSLAVSWSAHGPIMLGLALAMGLLVGVYPALHLTRVRTAEALRGNFSHSTAGQRVRTGLVVLQFAVSAALIVGTVGVWQQINHMKTQDPGVQQENVVVMNVRTEPFDSLATADTRLRTFRSRLLQDPGVQSVSFSDVVPTNYKGNFNTYVPGGSGGDGIRFRQVQVDQAYFETYGIELNNGQPFRTKATGKQWLTDEGAIVNAAAADRIRAATGDSTVIGATLSPGGSSFQVHVRDVTTPFRFQAAMQVSTPVLHYYSGDHPRHYQYVSVRMAPGAVQNVMNTLRTEWTRLYADIPFDFFFIDDAFDRLYRTQERIGTLAGIAAGLAVLLACLGLLSLAAFSIHQRLKEISVRKVLGASVASIVVLVSRRFLVLVGVALVLAAPAAYIVLDNWLSDFATRISLGPSLFLVTGAGIVLLAILTVGSQAARAARVDPAQTLRSE